MSDEPRLSSRAVCSSSDVVELITDLAGLRARDASVQTRYLAEFLAGKDYHRARFVIVERGYVDRHYLDEYLGHYATNFRPPSEKTTRLHFFESPAGAACPFEALARGLDNAAALVDSDDEDRRHILDRIEENLSARYVGFVVIRPLPDRIVGRTILKPPQAHNHECRNYTPAAIPHTVHLAGLRLRVSGLPFQQQDVNVGACATTALWSALASLSRRNGKRTPTPLEVSRQATRSLVNGEAGFTIEQMLDAIRAFGYAPWMFRTTGGADAWFQARLITYLNSGVPVILEVREREEGKPHTQGHAVTICGYRLGDDHLATTDDPLEVHEQGTTGRAATPSTAVLMEDTASADHHDLPGQPAPTPRVTLRMARPTRYFLHDDNVGPYMRRVWVRAVEGENGVLRRAAVSSRPSAFDHEIISDLEVRTAIVPLYPKIRLKAQAMLERAQEAFALLDPGDEPEMFVQTGYELSGSWLRDSVLRVPGLPKLSVDTLKALQEVACPRYVGIIRFNRGDSREFEFVLDSTVEDAGPALLAILTYRPLSAALQRWAETWAEATGASLLSLNPPTP